MVQRCRVSRLAAKSLDEILVRAERLGDGLDGNEALQRRVLTLVDLAHGALADLADNVVLA